MFLVFGENLHSRPQKYGVPWYYWILFNMLGQKLFLAFSVMFFANILLFTCQFVDFSSADSVDPSQHFIEKMPRSKGPMLTDCKARDDL